MKNISPNISPKLDSQNLNIGIFTTSLLPHFPPWLWQHTMMTIFFPSGETGAGTGGIVRATSKTPNQILIVPVGEPKVNPQLIFAPPQPAPQKTPQIIILPGNQFQVPTQQPPGQRPETTPRLSPQVTCSPISTAPLNSSTVRPSSSFVSSTVSQTMTTYVSILVVS